MKQLVMLALFSVAFSQELKVEGNLNVTGSMQSTTIDSLKQVIQLLEAQIAAMQGGNKLETRVFDFIVSHDEEFNIFEITGYNLEYCFLEFMNAVPANELNNDVNLYIADIADSVIGSVFGRVWGSYYGYNLNTFYTNLEPQRSMFLHLNNLVFKSSHQYAGSPWSIKLAITAQFTVPAAQQNLNIPQAEETK